MYWFYDISGILLFQPPPTYSHLHYINDTQQTVTNYLHHVSWNHLLEYLKSKSLFFIPKCEEGIHENTSQTAFLSSHYVLKCLYLQVPQSFVQFFKIS